jgi:hypothetical protein
MYGRIFKTLHEADPLHVNRPLPLARLPRDHASSRHCSTAWSPKTAQPPIFE